MPDDITIFAIAGSLRRESYNRAALSAAVELAPESMHIDVYEDLGKLPPFNEDKEWMPTSEVVDLKGRVRNASGILIVTPEYNYGVPGVLKNAIDWASRPSSDNAWDDKPVAIMGASTSMFGTVRAQLQLRQSFVFLNMHPLNAPEVMIANASEAFDENRRLVDETSRQLIRELLEGLAKVAREYEERTPEQAFPGFRPGGVAPRKVVSRNT